MIKIKQNTFFGISLLLLSCQIEGMELYVAADGSDSNTGTIDAPFATIIHARNTVRKKLLVITKVILPFPCAVVYTVWKRHLYSIWKIQLPKDILYGIRHIRMRSQ